MICTARAGTNIALVKYWGKRDAALNLPAAGSLSLTLQGLDTITSVDFSDQGSPHDHVFEGENPAGEAFARRTSKFLDLVRQRAGISAKAVVRTRNSFPTGAGLASSASGFAALALAATRAAGLTLSPDELSVLARRGSGSAARSIFGGFVQMDPGARADGTDAFAHPILDPAAWDLCLVVAVTTRAPKDVGSTDAMEHTTNTSPYYAAWIASVPHDLAVARAAIAARDLQSLGAVTERSALRMHASAMAADPGVLYWTGPTVAAMLAVKDLRRAGVPVFFTMDAGPHVKALCHTADADNVRTRLLDVPGVLDVIVARPGPGAAVVDGP